MKQSTSIRAQKSSKDHSSFDQKDLLNYSYPRSFLVRFLYKSFKYATLLSVLTFIVISGISILGDTSQKVNQARQMFSIYQNDDIAQQASNEISQILKKQSSKYVSIDAINLYLDSDPKESQSVQNRFKDLIYFTDYFLSRQFNNKKILRLPLNFNDQITQNIIPQSISMKLLQKLKQRVQRFLQKNKLLQQKNAKQITWNRIKKLVDNGKLAQIFQLIQENTLNYVWEWINDQPSVIILEVSNDKIDEKFFQSSRKALNKWLKQVSLGVKVIILSKQPLNNIYDIENQDHLKSYKGSVCLKTLSPQKFCKHFIQDKNLNQEQCLILKSRFETMIELEQFTRSFNCQDLSLKNEKLKSQSYNKKVLQKVCQKGHIKYQFYKDQQDAYKVVGRNKKQKKTRFQREIQVLFRKWSQMKKYIGINKLKDVYLTLKGQKSSEKQLTLQQANQLGLVYNFDLHQLKWRTEQDRIFYEVKAGKTCKGDKIVQQQIEEQEDKKRKKEQQEKGQYRQEKSEQGNQQQEGQVQEEYEQSQVRWDQDKKRDNSLDREKQVQSTEDQQQGIQNNEDQQKGDKQQQAVEQGQPDEQQASQQATDQDEQVLAQQQQNWKGAPQDYQEAQPQGNSLQNNIQPLQDQNEVEDEQKTPQKHDQQSHQQTDNQQADSDASGQADQGLEQQATGQNAEQDHQGEKGEEEQSLVKRQKDLDQEIQKGDQDAILQQIPDQAAGQAQDRGEKQAQDRQLNQRLNQPQSQQVSDDQIHIQSASQ